MTEAHPRAIPALDALRGISAVLVVLGHARESLFSAGDAPLTGSGASRILLVPTSLAMEAVAVFFMLSGYLVGGQVLELHSAGRFTWRGFVARRGSRLLVVLVPGLILTWLLDMVTRSIAPTLVQSSAASPDAFSSNTFLCNLVFLQDSRCLPYGSNGSLWSLSYELWFYILFAACVHGLWPSGISRAARAGAFAIAIGSVLIFGLHLLLLMPAWLLGAVTAWYLSSHSRLGHRSERLLALAFGGAGVWGLWMSQQGADHVVSYPLIGLGTIPVVVFLVGKGPSWHPSVLGPWVHVGGWSYSLYVFHLPVVVLMTALFRDVADARGWAGVPWVYGVAAAACGLCYPLSRVTERHTDALRRLLAAPSPRESSPGPAPG